MKTITKPAVSKLVKKFDNELKNILMNDLQLFMAKNPFRKQNVTNLSVA